MNRTSTLGVSLRAIISSQQMMRSGQPFDPLSTQRAMQSGAAYCLRWLACTELFGFGNRIHLLGEIEHEQEDRAWLEQCPDFELVTGIGQHRIRFGYRCQFNDFAFHRGISHFIDSDIDAAEVLHFADPIIVVTEGIRPTPCPRGKRKVIGGNGWGTVKRYFDI